MKVLYISGMYPTPAYPQKGIFCHEQVKALKRLGVEVDVAVPVPFYDRELRQSHWEYEGVPIRYVRFFKLPGARDFQRTGKNLFPALDRVFDLAAYDLYHADAALPSGQAAMLAGEKYGKPFVVHGHGLDVFLAESYAGLSNVEQIVSRSIEVFQKAAAVAGVSEKVLQRVRARVELGERGFVVYNGVDPERFCPKQKPESDTVHLISVGNLIPLKGHDDTLRALRSLLDRGFRADLKLVGAGQSEGELRALVRELGLSAQVEFTGAVPYGEVMCLMQQSDIFVLPSWYEALGCVYLEAMACGLPAIGCRGNGIDEVIEDGVTGCLVENKNPAQLAETLTRLMDPALRKEMGQKAREAAASRFTWLDSAASILNVYGKVTHDTPLHQEKTIQL